VRVVFHIISTGGGVGASRTTRYIAERDKDMAREGAGARPLFSEDRDDLTYRKADRILDPIEGQPEKNDLIHLSVSFEEEDFHKLGSDEKERQAHLRQIVREGMKGMAEELKVERLVWIAGIHRNSDNPHAHIVMSKHVTDRVTGKDKRIGRIPKNLLPHKQISDGSERIVPGRIGDKFLEALERQQSLYRNPDHEPAKTQAAWERLVETIQGNRADRSEHMANQSVAEPTREQRITGWELASRQAQNRRAAIVSWNSNASVPADDHYDFRLALGKQLEYSIRLAFAEVRYERAVERGETYRFEVVDQSTGTDRKISELDVHRRAAARSSRVNARDRTIREQAFATDLSQHRETLEQLNEARETKIAALGKDVGSLRGKLKKVEQSVSHLYEMPAEKALTPILSRETLAELQEKAVKLNLPDIVATLENLRSTLSHEHNAPTRTEEEAALLTAQVNVARADLMAKDARLENFEASFHLTAYEVNGERWSLAALDKQIARRHDDAKIIPDRAMRLDLRSLARFNYSTQQREAAAVEVEHLRYIRGEIVREIERRREPLIGERDLAREMVDVLESAYTSEQRAYMRDGQTMPEAKYERCQMNSLEASAETLRDRTLLAEVNEWEKNNSENWEGRALAREITSDVALTETKQRLENFLDNQRVASLHLGNERTATLRQVEARTITEYLARAIESHEQRDLRHAIKLAASEHHGKLVNDFEKARDYHETARELASEASGHEPEFTDREKINLEIYAERQSDELVRQNYLEMARGESQTQEQEIGLTHAR
jgi:MobL relaxases